MFDIECFHCIVYYLHASEIWHDKRGVLIRGVAL